MNENQELSELLNDSINYSRPTKKRSNSTLAVGDGDYDDIGRGGSIQFTTTDDVNFFPSGRTVKHLPPGVYEILFSNNAGYYFGKIQTKTEGLIRFPETNSDKVINEITDFWKKEHLYKQYDLAYKRGIILWGPPGSGKSSCIQLAIRDLINSGGVIIKFGYPDALKSGLKEFRAIQPDTPLIILMEDIDSILEQYNESDVLNIIDGVDRVEKIVFLATTNYPERLGSRIINRPSRFDRRFKMPHPSDESRKIYLEHLIKDNTIEEFQIDIDKWAADSKGMSISHLKELFTAVVILGNDYEDTIETLQTMTEKTPHSKNDLKEGDFDSGIGFQAKLAQKARRGG